MLTIPAPMTPITATTRPAPAVRATGLELRQSARALTCTSAEPWERLRVFDAAGRALAESAFSREWTLAMESLAAGPYWIVAEWAGYRSSRAVVLG